MAEGKDQGEDQNSTLSLKPATECVWDIKLFQNLGYAAQLACIECGHPPKRCLMDKDHQTLCELHAEPFLQKGDKIIDNPFADSMVAKAEIACKNALFDPDKADDEKKEEPKQCEWKGLVKDWQTHNDRDCTFTVVNCEDCCEYSSSRSLQPAHHEVCPFATIDCPLTCGGKILRKDTKTHTEDECPQTVMDCTNAECTCKIIRRLFDAHVTQECPKRIVPCPYGVYGCTQPNVKFESMEEHLQQFEIKHLQFQLNSLYELVNRQQQQQPQKQECEVARGMISRFGGGVSDIPDGWVLCDGGHGTPNLRKQFVLKSAVYTDSTHGHTQDTADFEISEAEMEDDEDMNVVPSYSMIWIMKV
eukprot:1164686_1